MEKSESGCVILKQKEYDELVAKAKDNSPKEIRVYWSGDLRYNGYTHTSIGGDFVLSEKISSQVHNILGRCNAKLTETTSLILLDGSRNGFCEARDMFEKLPWRKRLFFKPGYLKRNEGNK